MENALRGKLRKIANPMKAKVQIGKDGLTENIVNQIKVELENREIVKVKILQNCDIDARETSDEVCAKLGAMGVLAVGGTFVLYKRSTKKGVEHIV